MIEVVVAGMLGWMMISKAMGNGSSMKRALEDSKQVYKSEVKHGETLLKIQNSLKQDEIR